MLQATAVSSGGTCTPVSPGETEQPSRALPCWDPAPSLLGPNSSSPQVLLTIPASVPCLAQGTVAAGTPRVSTAGASQEPFALQGLGLSAKRGAEVSKGSMESERGQRQGKIWKCPNGDIHSLTESPIMSETRPWRRDNSTVTASLESRSWLACSAGGKKRMKR